MQPVGRRFPEREQARWPTSGLVSAQMVSGRARASRRGAGFKVIGLVALCCFGLFAVARAEEPELRLSSKKIRDAVHVVVEAQLAALRAGDFAAAYALASTGIKAQFDEQLFALMIRRGYPLLLQSGKADLGLVRDQDGKSAQVTVIVPDRQKRSVVYRYWLVLEEAGWRINGVTLEQRPPRGDI